MFKNQRTKYLNAMPKADAGDYGPLGEVIARAVTNNLYKFVVPAVAGPARLVPLASLADNKPGITTTARRAAAERGRLKAQKTPSGAWLSSKNWVTDYQANKHKRTLQPDKPCRGTVPRKVLLPDVRTVNVAHAGAPSRRSRAAGQVLRDARIETHALDHASGSFPGPWEDTPRGRSAKHPHDERSTRSDAQAEFGRQLGVHLPADGNRQ